MLTIGFLWIDSGDQEVTIKILKGEYEALRIVVTEKNCSFAAEMK